MIIGFDFQPLVQRASGGEVQWLRGIIIAYARQFPEDRILLFDPEDFSLELPQFPSVERITATRHALHEVESDILRARGVDVLIRTYPTITHPVFPMERQIVVVPDMQFAERSEFADAEILRHRRLAFGRMLSEVGAVATMTDFSLASILHYPWTVCSDVFLMPPAVDPDIVSTAPQRSPTNATWEKEIQEFARFFFMPANSWPSKNHRRLFEAFALARSRLPAGTGLVLTGAGGEWPKLLSETGHLPIRHLGYLSRSDIANLYLRAQALVFFSNYEGFGMPLLEAFHFGTPVVCSNIAALAEVGKDAVLSCAPDDVQGMSDQMVRIIADSGLRQVLAARGKERLKNFSWEKSARALHDAVRRVEMRARGERPAAQVARFGGRLTVILDADLGGSVAPAAQAVVSQSHLDWELLVVSRASCRPEGLPEDARIRLVAEDDPNAAERGTRALAAATGDGRIYLRPDCILGEDALSRIAARFREDAASDIVACGTVAINRRDEVLSGWSLPVHSSESIDLRSVENFVFESDLLANLGRDFRGVRPLVAWRRRIEAIAPGFDRAMPFAFDMAYWLRLVNAGGTLAVINDSLASICMSDDSTRARYWYHVMRDCERLATRRQVALDKGFFRLLDHRRMGLDPTVTRAWRRLPSVMGWCDYRIYRARLRWATLTGKFQHGE
jgi:glycosyltransferase involved in cell wall biosynthesis